MVPAAEKFNALEKDALIPAKLKFRRPVAHLLPCPEGRAREKAKLLEIVALARERSEWEKAKLLEIIALSRATHGRGSA